MVITWSKIFDRELTGVFAVQDEISSAVVERSRCGSCRAESRGSAPSTLRYTMSISSEDSCSTNQRLRITGGQLPPMSGHWRSILISLPRGGLAETTFSIVNFAETSGAIT